MKMIEGKMEEVENMMMVVKEMKAKRRIEQAKVVVGNQRPTTVELF